jgi:hypothetical protein
VLLPGSKKRTQNVFRRQGPTGKPDVFKLALVRVIVVWEERTRGLQQLKVGHFGGHRALDGEAQRRLDIFKTK